MAKNAPALAILLICALRGAAHDIPADVTVHVLMKPSGQSLQMMVRVPLTAIRDLEYPETPAGTLDIEKLAPQLPNMAQLWIAGFVDVYEGGTRLGNPRVAATGVSLPSDRSFTSFEQALAHFAGPKLASSDHVYANHVVLDVLMEYGIRSEASAFSIEPRFQHLAERVVTVLRFVQPGGVVRAYEFSGNPGLVALDPRWEQAFGRFVQLGFSHILQGTDHLLFLLCLVIPFRRLRPLVQVVTAFTAAHSMALAASALNYAPDALWFPPLIELLIAVSIVYMALENIFRRSTTRARWMMAFGFGLIHGFGFAFALRKTMQFAGSHLMASFAAFNIGVELGQVAVLLLLIPVLNGLFRFATTERTGIIIVSALVAHTGWHWMLDRADRLSKFRFEWPEMSAAQAAAVLGWAALVLILVLGGGYLVRAWTQRRARREPVATS